MKHLIILLAAFAITLPSLAQDSRKKTTSKKEEKRQRINKMIKQEEEGVIAYKKHFAGGIKLASDGYGLFIEKGKAKSIKKALLFQLEIAERKHQKEEKQSLPGSSGLPIIYGKINFFYPIKLGVQQQFLLGNKSNKNGVAITANFGGGISLGLLRPYFINTLDSTGNRKDVRYESADSLLFLDADIDPFAEGPGLGKGWKYMKMTPGLYAKAALRFDFGRYNELMKAIEVGLTGEFYTKKIPQMVYVKQKQFFFGAYFSILFGRRK